MIMKNRVSLMRVTFDSNVYRLVVDPSKDPDHRFHKDLQVIHNAVQRGIVVGLLSETIATLEGVLRRDRADYLSSVVAKDTSTEYELDDGRFDSGFRLVPTTPSTQVFLPSSMAG